MYNLHIHTPFSDGKDSPEKIIYLAENLRLSAIAFTDHDNCDVWNYLTPKMASKFSGDIVIGAELKCYHAGTPIEILAYGYDIQKLMDSGITSK